MIEIALWLSLGATPGLEPVAGETMLDGMDVLVARVEAPTCAARFVVRAGSDRDPFGRGGLAHIVEHLVLAGPAGRDTLRSGHGVFNGETSRDSTVFTMLTRAEDCQQGLGELLWAVSEGRFTADQLANQRSVVMREQVYLGAWQQALIEAGLFGDVAPVVGTAASREDLTLSDVGSFYRERYAPPQLALVVVGPVSLNDVVGVVRRTFTGVPTPDLAGARRSPRDLRTELDRRVNLVSPLVVATARPLPLSAISLCRSAAAILAIRQAREIRVPGVDLRTRCFPMGGYAVVATIGVAPTLGRAESLKKELVQIWKTPLSVLPAERQSVARRLRYSASMLGATNELADELATLAAWSSRAEFYGHAENWLSALDAPSTEGEWEAAPLYVLSGKERR